MFEVFDRIPTYPGRVKLNPVAGQANTYDMVRADDPIEPGTPINRALFASIAATMEATKQLVENKLLELAQRVTIGGLAVGAIFGLYENGLLVPYIKIATGYKNTGRPFVLRLDCIKMDTLISASDSGAYADCKTDRWLTNEFYYTLDTATQSVLSETTISIGDSSSIKRKVFLLDASEYGFFGLTSYNSNSVVAEYFDKNAGRIPAKFSGTLVNQWTRSSSASSKKANAISTTGTLLELSAATEQAGIRPAFTLPADFEVIAGMPSTANTMATAEVI